MDDLTSAIATIFSPAGTLAQRQGFEHRPQQAAMAIAVASALVERSHLVVEAPTGVGKTLAYLLPSLLYTLQHRRKAIISTHTKNLQEQLIQKDIPLARSVIGADVSVATLKGRRNYLCTTRLEYAVGAPSSHFDKEARAQLLRIRDWSCRTPDGDLEDLSFTPRGDVWDAVCSEQGVCSSALCAPHCFYQRAKARAREAHVLIINHALFFSLLSMSVQEDRFLFEDDFVIFDEAHTLEAIAGAGIGLKVSHRQVILALHRLYHPTTKKGLLGTRKKRPIDLCAKAEQTADEFFATVRHAAQALAVGIAPPGSSRHEIRIRTPHVIVNALEEALVPVEDYIRDVEEHSDDLFQRQELSAARAGIHALRTSVEAFLEQLDVTLTYWVELSGGASSNVTLCAAPSDIGEVLGERLFRGGTSVIMTSATLSVNGSLDYFRTRLGATDAEPLILDSPFDHARQMALTLARDIAEPETEAYPRELPAWIMRSIDRTHGKALVLFTSAALMRSTAALLAEEFSRRGLTLLVQGVDAQRHQLLEEFKRDIHSVLFGLDSFWMGVDVPGEALEHVIITRLPFAVPNHPLIEARLEQIAARGGNAFMEYTLPEAILKFKQGAGRLIRTSEDRGYVTILDSRIVRKSYGRAFVASLPRCPVELWSSSGEVERIEPGER